MKKCGFGSLDGSWNHRIIRAGAGLLVLAILFLGPLPQANNELKSTTAPTAPPLSSSLSIEHAGVPWYFRSGQWRADVRSLVAVLRYLTQSDSPAQTNLTPAKVDNV